MNDTVATDGQGHVWPAARRAGDFIFAGGHTPHNLDTGRLVLGSSDLPGDLEPQVRAPVLFTEIVAGRCRAQTRQVLENLKRSLEAAGGSADRLAHLRVFLADLTFEGTVLAALRNFFGESLPSGEIVEARNAGSHPEILVQVDCIGLTGDAAAPEHVHIDSLAALADPFPVATRAGGLLFSSQLPGADQASGEALASTLQLTARGRNLLGPLAETATRHHRPFFVQQAAMWDHLLTILDALGIPHAATLYHMNWMARPMKVFADGSVTRSIMRHTGDYLLTCFPTSGLRTPNAELEGRIVAILPESGWRKDVRLPVHGVSNSYFGVIGVGPYLFAAGEVPIDTGRWRLMGSFKDLAPPYCSYPFGKPYREQPVQPQSHYIYSLYEEALAAHGASLADAVQQTAYMTDAGDGPAFEGVIATRFPTGAPATTIVPIIGASPFVQTRLELELIAFVGPRP